MATDWESESLSKYYDFSSGLSKCRSEFGFGYGFLTFKDVLDNFFVPGTLTALVNSTGKERATCSVRKGDVFLTRTSETQDELGMSCVALKDYENATFNGFTKRLRPKPGTPIVPEYAAYFFRGPRFRRAVTAMSSLSTRASLNNEMLARLSIVIPPIGEQILIGKMLKSLDDKIDLNRRMNETLELLARAIFKSWFVDFDPVRAKMAGHQPTGMNAETAAFFPDSLEDSALGPIPEGWKAIRLSEICQVGRGSSPRPINDYMNGEIPWIKIADATASAGPFVFETAEFLKPEGVSKSVRVSPGDLILSNSATCGLPVFVEIDGCIHDGWLHFGDLRHVSKIYLFHVLKRLSDHLVHIADGSVQKNLNTSLVGDQIVLVPADEVSRVFDLVVAPMFDCMRNNLRESRTVATIRDSLLPKLLSGEIRRNGLRLEARGTHRDSQSN